MKWKLNFESNLRDKNCVKAKPNGCENETECTWSGDKYKLVIILVY